jgi:hypothetical protein
MLEKTDRTVVPPHLRMCRFATQTHELPDGRVEGGSGTAKAAAGAGAGAIANNFRNLDWEGHLWRRQGGSAEHAENPNMEAPSIKDASWHVEPTTIELTVGYIHTNLNGMVWSRPKPHPVRRNLPE